MYKSWFRGAKAHSQSRRPGGVQTLGSYSSNCIILSRATKRISQRSTPFLGPQIVRGVYDLSSFFCRQMFGLNFTLCTMRKHVLKASLVRKDL